MKHFLALLFGFGLLCLYFPILKYWKKREEEKKNHSAEEYFDEMMHASYGDNMAVRGRLDDDASDRVFEFEPEEDPTNAPPSSFFKVHVARV